MTPTDRTPNGPVDEIRARLDHPVIDSDGHVIEFLPAVCDHLKALAGQDVVDRFNVVINSAEMTRQIDAQTKRELGILRMPWWGLPTRNTLDRATAMLPQLMYDRLDEFGLDFAVLYPTYGLFSMSLDDDELRCAVSRAFNEYQAETFKPYSDRLTPVAIIPMHTPEEAIEALDHAVLECGLKAAMVAGHVMRPFAGVDHRKARWMDTFCIDSVHDYDPVWARFSELGVAPTFHSSGMGWGSRDSVTNYVFNHLGNFATAGESICRALFMGGVPWRFPNLKFAFLEGGVGWGANLYADIIGHWEKRNPKHIQHYNPANLDRELLVDLFKRYGTSAMTDRIDRLGEGLNFLSEPAEDPGSLDEFSACEIESSEDIRQVFEKQFHFGCEADDPMNASAFNTMQNPLGARLPAIFSSDIGHWDVPDMREVLEEAWELVDDGVLTTADFRAFVFENPVSLWAGGNPDFFKGTVVEDAVAKQLSSS
jgi:predicted TIM-barrel fold metal-dependent hydrolase